MSPSDWQAECNKRNKLYADLMDKYGAEVRKSHSITLKQLDAIYAEGMKRSWTFPKHNSGSESLTELSPRSGAEPSVTEVKRGEQGIVGKWFSLCTNPDPTYYDKIALDYLIYTFAHDGTVVEIRNSGKTTETTKGTYEIDPKTKIIQVSFNRHQYGIQVTSWRLEGDGRVRIFHFKNKTKNLERDADDIFIREGSEEWKRHNKISLH
jgi:hypothetical protein